MNKVGKNALLTTVAMLSFGLMAGLSGHSERNHKGGGENITAPLASGSLAGTIRYDGAMPKKRALKITKDVQVCGKEKHYNERLLVGADKGLQNVVASIKGVTGGDLKSLGTNFELHQTGCVFKPHVSIVPVKTSFTIYNNDGLLHNLHTFSKKNRPFNLAQPKFRKKLQKNFKKPEIVQIRCDVHSWMVGYIVVVDHPYHAISGQDGKYTIKNIPAGTYQVEFWHEKLGVIQKEIKIEAGQETKLNLSFAAKKKRKKTD